MWKFDYFFTSFDFCQCLLPLNKSNFILQLEQLFYAAPTTGKCYIKYLENRYFLSKKLKRGVPQTLKMFLVKFYWKFEDYKHTVVTFTLKIIRHTDHKFLCIKKMYLHAIHTRENFSDDFCQRSFKKSGGKYFLFYV